MKISTLFWIAAAVIGGIYVTSEEGKQVRRVLEKKKSAFKPIVDDLLRQANEILQGSQEVNSSQVRANVDKLVKQAKLTLSEIDLEKTIDTIKESIRVATKKIRQAFNEVEKGKPHRSEHFKTGQT
ncbi:hypothetical protein [Mycoplasma sp. ATU-Cv-703]|uniref:hypothetical protein n=1 Tax=Mycoplasma sp. ATU-Cv-703 TaxID=2498595 RepID=UPI000FDDF36B